MPSVSSRLGLALLTFVCSALRVFEPRFSVFAMIGGLLPRRTSFELFDEMRFSWRHDLLLRPPVIRTQRSHRKAAEKQRSRRSHRQAYYLVVQKREWPMTLSTGQ